MAVDGKAEELGLIPLGGLSFAGDVVAVCPGLLRGRGAEGDLEEGLGLFVGVQLVDVGLRVDVGGGDELRLDRAGVADAVGLTADDAVGVGDEAAADDGVLAAEIAGDRAAVGAGGGGLAGDSISREPPLLLIMPATPPTLQPPVTLPVLTQPMISVFTPSASFGSI